MGTRLGALLGGAVALLAVAGGGCGGGGKRTAPADENVSDMGGVGDIGDIGDIEGIGDAGDAGGMESFVPARVQEALDLSQVPLPRFVCQANAGSLQPGLAPCPRPPEAGLERWSVRRVFEPDLEHDIVPPDIDTGVLCMYDWVGPPPESRAEQEELLPILDASGEPLLQPCEGDAPVVVPLALEEAPDTVFAASPELYVVAARQAGVVERCAPAVSPIGAKVTVAIVDSVPTKAAAPIGPPRLAMSLHGTIMALLVRDFAGPDGAGCAASVLQTLALDLRWDEALGFWVTDTAEGGSVGTLASVAQATWDAVRFWVRTAPGSRLVVNYSIGWTPTPLTVPGGSLGANAVLASIQAASDRGALLLAAAGNRVAGPDPGSGPMLPAGFEIGPASAGCLGAECPPLVRAVGAVEAESRLLATSRPNALPRLVAWGHLTVPDAAHLGAEEQQTKPYFPALAGTSVATALASAAAAAVWAQEPGLDAEAVSDEVWAAGAAFAARQADFCAGSASPCGDEVRRLDVCRATGKGACPTAPPATVEAVAAGFASMAELDTSPLPEAPGAFALQSPCGPGYVLSAVDPSALEYECPELQIIGYEAQAFVYPQPGDHGCDNCLLTTSPDGLSTVHLLVNPRLNRIIERPRLVLGDTASSTAVAIDLGLASLAPGEARRVTGIDLLGVSFDVAWIVSTSEGVLGKRTVSVDVLAR